MNQVLELFRTLTEHRGAEVRRRLEKVGREASMLHVDLLLLIYHRAHFGQGMCLRSAHVSADPRLPRPLVRIKSGTQKEIVTIEAGWSVKHFRLWSRNIIKDWKKISRVRQRLRSREVGVFNSTRTTTCVVTWIAPVTC